MPPRPETKILDPEIGASPDFSADDIRYFPKADEAQQDPDQLGETDFEDGSIPLFSMYLERAEKEDKKRAESWKGDADGMLIFSGLFSAAVAVLLAVTVQDIRPNPQDTSAYYLANILQQLAQSNGTEVPIPSTLHNPAAPFNPPTWAVWVNGLWFMSLVTSLTCAALATLLQQWARRYLRVAYPRYSPHKRARIRAFYANGIEKLYLPEVVEVLPALLHISLFLFFAGLVVFLFGVNISIFQAVIIWVGLCVLVYAYLTILSTLHKDSPYSTPFSALVPFCLTSIRSLFFPLVARFSGFARRSLFLTQLRNRDSRTVQLGDFVSHSMRKIAEEFAFRLGPEIDYESLVWTFQSLSEDEELGRFFEGISGLCDSRAVPNALDFIKRNQKMFSSVLIGLMDRTLSSNLVSEAVKLRRIIICTQVIDATSLLGSWWTLRRVLLGDWQKFLDCIEFGLFVQNWTSIPHPVTRFYAQCVISVTISSVPVQELDDRWFQLASGPLGTSKNLFQNYLKHRDNILLANAISILRQTIQTYSGSAERHRSDILGGSSRALKSLRKLDLSHTFPDLQHEFCAVWNQLVDLAQNDVRPHIVFVSKYALKNIRRLYIALHRDTSASPTAFSSATDYTDPILNDAWSYCKCDLVEHRPPQPVPDLQIEEPSPEAGTYAPPMPVVGTIPAAPLPVVHPPFFIPRSPVSAPSFPLLTSPIASNKCAQAASEPATSPIVVPTLPSPTVPRIPPAFLTVGVSNEGAPSVSPLNLASSSSLDYISTSRLPHSGETRETSQIYTPTFSPRDPILAAFVRHIGPPTGGSPPRDVPDTEP